MKAKIEGITEIWKMQVKAKSGAHILADYDKIVKRQHGTFDGTWFERNSPCFRAAFWIRFQSVLEMPALSVRVISYDVPTVPTIGLERRQASSLLRSLGLRSPTTREMLHIASQALDKDFQLFRIIWENSCRDLVALTPFHPEMPTFMKFGTKDKEGPSFKMQDHRIEVRSGYFFTEWDLPIKWPVHPDDMKKFFPMLLGISQK